MSRDRVRAVVEWRDCPSCWGQGRIYEQRPEGWTVESCPTCLGVGQVARATPVLDPPSERGPGA